MLCLSGSQIPASFRSVTLPAAIPQAEYTSRRQRARSTGIAFSRLNAYDLHPISADPMFSRR